MGVAAPGHITTRGVDRDVALSGDQTGVQLGLELAHARELAVGEGAHLAVGELDVFLDGCRERATRGRDLLLADDEAVGLPVVQLP